MNLWRWLRQSDRIEGLTVALDEQLRLRGDAAQLATVMDVDRSRERALRISAETLAVERRAEVERLIAEIAAVREDLRRLTDERLKSLDALNVKLMTERAEEKPPDMEQYKRNEELASVGMNAVRRMSRIHHQMDTAILTRMHPRFAKVAGAVMNEMMESQPAD